MDPRNFTPEQRRIYDDQLRERNESMVAQPWVETWPDKSRVVDVAAVTRWARSRPPVIQELMCRFPPHALVRAKPEKNLMVPAPGTVAIVASYHEDGSVSVIQNPNSQVRCQCDADWIELVTCVEGATVEDIRAMLTDV